MANTTHSAPPKRPRGSDYFEATGSCTFVAAAPAGDGGEPAKFPRLTIEAYTGVACQQAWSAVPVVTDLAGVKVGDVSLLLDHAWYDWDAILGDCDTVDNNGRALLVAGDVIGDGPMVEKYIRLASRGKKFQASIGAIITRRETIESGVQVTVNGRDFTGPLVIVRECTLMEVSVLLFGADANTSAAIAAKAMMEGVMPKDNQIPAGAAGTPAAPANVAAGNDNQVVQAGAQPTQANTVVQQSASQAPAAGTDGASAAVPAGFDYDRLAQAIIDRGGDAALQAVRGNRVSAPAAHVKAGSNAGNETDVFTAALCVHAGMEPAKAEKHFKPELLEAAHAVREQVSLAQLIFKYARKNGWTGEAHKISQTNAPEILKFAFSSHDLSNVLAGTYRKFLLDGYESEEDPYELMSATGPLADYKESKGVRVLGDFSYRKVPATGRIEHAKLSDEARPIKADLWARCTQISTIDMTNDDAGALSGMAMMLGEGGKRAIIEEWYRVFLAGVASGYFAAATPGSGNAFSLSSLKSAGAAVLRLKDAVGNPIRAQHRLLFVPPELYDGAIEAMNGTLIVTGESKTVSATSALKGRYTPATSTHLPSATTWWTVGGRPSLQPMQIGYVDNQRSPTVQSAVADFDSFGIQFRGFWGFGIALGDPLGAYTMATS
jgi:hypothetical protein